MKTTLVRTDGELDGPARSLALVMIGALILAGVLVTVLARFAAMPAVSANSAPLARSERLGVDKKEAPEWSRLPNPAYAR
jgi:hypothetical protein